jgi:hypothetical protein
MSGRAAGSTGQGPWWELTLKEQKPFLGKKDECPPKYPR